MHKLATTHATKTIHAPRVCTHVRMHNVSTWLSGQNEDLQSVIAGQADCFPVLGTYQGWVTAVQPPLVLGALMARYRTGLSHRMSEGLGVTVWGSAQLPHPTKSFLSGKTNFTQEAGNWRPILGISFLASQPPPPSAGVRQSEQ